jgi:hypothetical protein
MQEKIGSAVRQKSARIRCEIRIRIMRSVVFKRKQKRAQNAFLRITYKNQGAAVPEPPGRFGNRPSLKGMNHK